MRWGRWYGNGAREAVGAMRRLLEVWAAVGAMGCSYSGSGGELEVKKSGAGGDEIAGSYVCFGTRGGYWRTEGELTLAESGQFRLDLKAVDSMTGAPGWETSAASFGAAGTWRCNGRKLDVSAQVVRGETHEEGLTLYMHVEDSAIVLDLLGVLYVFYPRCRGLP